MIDAHGLDANGSRGNHRRRISPAPAHPRPQTGRADHSSPAARSPMPHASSWSRLPMIAWKCPSISRSYGKWSRATWT